MSIAYEAGGFGSLVSLGGVLGGRDRGRVMEMLLHNTPAAGAQILGSNPRRIAAMILNRSAVEVDLFFDGITIAWSLLPGEHFQIDKNFPWVGEVFAFGVGGGGANYIHTLETSVQQ